MKMLLASDLHLEFAKTQQHFMKSPIVQTLPDPSEYDIVVLAGDIGSGFNGLNTIRLLIPEDKLIIFVPGNHEHYGKDYTVMNVAFQNYKIKNTIIMSPGAKSIDGITFIGATLWSSATLNGYPNTRDQIQRAIADFRVVKYGPIEMFSVGRMQLINDREKLFIEEQLQAAKGKKVVITHFLPTTDCIHPKYAGDALNPYFVNELDYLVEEADLWLFGHTHERMDLTHKSGTRMVCNPHGYPNEVAEPWAWKVIEVE